jgi:hypothetical protein
MEDDDRLPTELWLKAHLRRLAFDAIPAYVTHKGSKTGGTVLLKLNQLDLGCRILTQARDAEGRLGWLGAKGGAFMPEAEADAYVARAVARDPDLWVVEIEDRQGRHPFEGKTL